MSQSQDNTLYLIQTDSVNSYLLSTTGTLGQYSVVMEKLSQSYARHNIPDMFDLPGAVTVIRSVRSLLEPKYCKEGETSLEMFYDLVERMEDKVDTTGDSGYRPIVIVVEASFFFLFCLNTFNLGHRWFW